MSKNKENDPVGRDRAGRFRSGMPSPNPKGRPRKRGGVDGAILRALAEKVTVVEKGTRRQRSKLDIAAAQVANQGAGGVLRAAKLGFDEARKAEAQAAADAVRAPVMTQADHEIASRVIARLTMFISQGGSDDESEA